MKGKSKITLGDILNLMDRDSTEVSVHDQQNDGALTGEAKSKLWKPLEGMIVTGITPTKDGLDVWVAEEDDHGTEKSS